MPRDLVSRYIWIVDTLTRHSRLTRKELNNLWVVSSLSDGEPMPERTFYHYRRAIEEILNLKISCDSSGKYYIDEDYSSRSKNLTNWMLDSLAVSNVLKDVSVPEGRVEIEDVPSAREFLPIVLESIRQSKKLNFTYAGFSRSRAESKIIFHPYFLKRYKQRWYVIGLKEKGNSIRTYALDRIKEAKIIDETFEMPGSLTMEQMFGNIVGVTTSQAPVRTVKLKATLTQAKYFRALPLHPSQSEEIHDEFSIFTYRLKLNYELVHDILALGEAVQVIEPVELKTMVVNELKNTLSQYK